MVAFRHLGRSMASSWHAGVAVVLPIAQNGEAAAPLLRRLDPLTRVLLIMALLGVVLLGIFLAAMVMVGGRWVRRISRSRPRPERAKPGSQHAEWRRALRDKLPDAGTSETVHDEDATHETHTED